MVLDASRFARQRTRTVARRGWLSSTSLVVPFAAIRVSRSSRPSVVSAMALTRQVEVRPQLQHSLFRPPPDLRVSSVGRRRGPRRHRCSHSHSTSGSKAGAEEASSGRSPRSIAFDQPSAESDPRWACAIAYSDSPTASRASDGPPRLMRDPAVPKSEYRARGAVHLASRSASRAPCRRTQRPGRPPRSAHSTGPLRSQPRRPARFRGSSDALESGRRSFRPARSTCPRRHSSSIAGSGPGRL